MKSEEKRPDRPGSRKSERRVDQGSEAALRPAMPPRDASLIGSYVGKDPSSGATRAVLGKVVSYAAGTGLFRVLYEDGDCEDLEHQLVREFLLVDDGVSGMKLSCRKRKLDQLVSSTPPPNTRSRKIAPNGSRAFPGTRAADSSCDSARTPASDRSSQGIEIPPLPPSSGGIGVPEESVVYLFSVYNFLRSFSFQLFLSPFGLHDFVGALNHTVQNSLLDAVHVSLMRALRRHLETLSSQGSELASKCLRHYDWTLLDALTWPVFLADYLYIMGYMKEMDEEEFSMIVSESDYYALPEATKLKVLQILCDDIIDSAELRLELEMRDNMEEEKECNAGANVPPKSGPWRLHPRYSKTSAWKDSEAMPNSAEPSMPNPASKVTKPEAGATDAAPDGNGDECRLCGMDGTLICCDSCPSAYHSRCIGLNKALLPDGLWFCPECTVNELGPTASRIGRGARGAEVFGIDTYGQIFLGTCNYLLVIGTSVNAEPVSRYYNQDDVAKVLSAICSKGENLSAYADICRGISKYWEVSLVNTQTGKTKSIADHQVDKEPAIGYRRSSVKNSTNVFYKDGENQANTITESSAENWEILSRNDVCNGARVNGHALDLVVQASLPDSQKYDMASDDTSTKKTPEATDGTSLPPKNGQFVTGDATKTVQKTLQFMQNKSSHQHGNGSVVTDASHLSQPISAERSTAADIVTCASGNESGICREDAGSSIFSKNNDSISMSDESKHGRHIYSEKCRTISDMNANIPASFKPQAYINQYILGDVAASAAANLVVLASDESRVSEAHVSSNPRKAASASIALQMKAFSGTATHFLWPSYEKKLVEVPRERCGWCFACKGASTNKRGCFLNLSAANAIKGSARNISGLLPIKHDESHLPAIAARIANMEESLHGLVIGPFLDARYNQQWHKQAREASSCRILKSLLLELEKNIRGIAFSGDWIKMVDDWSVEFSAALTGTSHAGPNQMRGSGGKRNKNQSVASKLVRVSPNDSENGVQWWRGAKLSKVAFQKGALPGSLVRKAARQGGCRRIPGINYPEGSDISRRSRQFAWRASVEMSKNASQLALQVRYLDAHLRWRDLVRPDQTALEGKGPDFVASAFRNAVICDRKIAESKIAYALTFANKKHLPLRVTKNILEAKRTQDENGKLWFSENHVPLYLIKEFEEKVGAKSLPSSLMIGSNCLIGSRRRQLKSHRRDIFLYLLHKWVKPSKCLCASCQEDIFLRDAAVRCSTCQGYCHKDCMIPSTVHKEDDLEFLFTCNLCYHAKSATLIKSHKEALNGQLSSQDQGQQLAGSKCMLQVGLPQTAPMVGVGLPDQTARTVDKMEAHPGSSVLGSNSERKARRGGLCHSYGLIWKRKKDNNDSGKDFRQEYIILKSKEGMDLSKKPACCLCNMPYRSDLMYIRCEKCPNWYHADALNLEEAQIFDLIGFKCCKCRRKSSPKCPYLDPDYRKPDVEPLKQRNAERNEKAISLESHSKMEDLVIVDDDPLLRFGDGDVDNSEFTDQLHGPGSVSFEDSSRLVDKCDSTGKEAAFDGVACEKCKINQSSPNLICEICGLCIHSRCSPWDESEEPSGGAQWRCGYCREWR